MSKGHGQFCCQALRVGSPKLEPSGPALLCGPSKEQGPLSQVLQLLRGRVSSLFHHRWHGQGEEGIFPLPSPPHGRRGEYGQLAHSHTPRASSPGSSDEVLPIELFLQLSTASCLSFPMSSRSLSVSLFPPMLLLICLNLSLFYPYGGGMEPREPGNIRTENKWNWRNPTPQASKNDNDEGKLLPAASRVGAGDLISLLSKAAGKGSLAGPFFFFSESKACSIARTMLSDL